MTYHSNSMNEKELCELMMDGLACLKEKVRNNKHILNSVRTAELEKIVRAQRMLSSMYSKMEAKPRVKKTTKKVAKKKGNRRK